MSTKRVICQLAGVGALLLGFGLSAGIDQSMYIKCFKPPANQKRFCHYGIGIFPTTSRNRCSDEQVLNVICEETEVSFLHPSLKDSRILVDPTGTYIQKATLPGRSKGARVPRLVIVNYRTKDLTYLDNYSERSQDEIEFLKKEFDLFLKNPDQKPFQMSEEKPYPLAGAIPLAVVSVVIFIVFFKESLKY
jgi:hypothetical protein